MSLNKNSNKTNKQTKNSQFRACPSFAQNSFRVKAKICTRFYEALGILTTFQRVDLSSIPHPDWPTLFFLTEPFRPSCCTSNWSSPSLGTWCSLFSLSTVWTHSFPSDPCSWSLTPWGFHWFPPLIWNWNRTSHSSTQSSWLCSCKYY